MKLQDLLEMPISGGDLRQSADKFAANMIHKFQDVKPIADIEEFTVKQLQAGNGFHYALFSGDEMVLLAFVKPLDKMMYPVLKMTGEAAEVDDVWVAKHFEGKRLYSKFLWFLKSREGYHNLIMGKVQSDDTIKFLKAGGLSKFNKTWQNTATGSVKVFDTAKMDDYYKTQNWRLVLENDSTEFDDYNRFNEGRWIQESYDWQIE
jgi:hypothetical protein